ncbi:hypothetical protein [Nitrosomonas aestuarii]|nr:hypothetical protein [Nitrosomonas aestuarii]
MSKYLGKQLIPQSLQQQSLTAQHKICSGPQEIRPMVGTATP